MAKAKKKGNLSLEEKLEQALVPVEEQPYEVPENWCWTYLKSGFDVTSSKRVHKSDWVNSGIPFYRTRELVKLSSSGEVDNELFISEELYDNLVREYGKPNVGDILVSGVGTIGVPYVISSNEKFYFKDGNVIWLKNKKLFNPKYVYYMYKSLFMYNQIHDMSAGTTVDTYTIVNANMTKIPLPPLAEQQRIVEQIENLFEKLDKAKEKAQEVVDSFETRKAMILHKAFSGELTAQWREKYKLRIDDWKEITIDNIASLITKGASPRWQGISYTNDTSQTLFVTSENVREGYLSFEKEKYIDNKINEIQKRSILHYGDVLVNIVGASIGRAAVFNRNQLANVNQAVCIIRLNEGISNQFLCLYLNSPLAQMYFSDNKVETARANISLSDIKAMRLKLPKIDEQLAIIRILQELFANEQQAKEAAESVIDQIDIMKKSILARAFRGGLGTNNPEEASSIELLKQILTRE